MCVRVCARVLLLAAIAGSAGWGAEGEVVVSGGSSSGSGAGPAFAPRQRTAALAAVGQSATLDCRVLRLADKSVSWVRSSDLQILSHAGAVFTADSRVSATSGAGAGAVVGAGTGAGAAVSHHTLHIERLRTADAGRYECQVNTEPKMSLFFNLTVLDEPVPVVVVSPVGGGEDGEGVVVGRVGGTATLGCSARYEPPPRRLPLPQLDIRWTKHDQLINLQSSRGGGGGGGGVSLETERWSGRVESRLTLAALQPADAGAYRCSAGGTATQLRLLLTDAHADEQLDAMQRDQSAGARVSSAWSHARTWPHLTLTPLLVAATHLFH